MELNVVYIGSQTFPKGGAMTKRWRYMIDYMNNHSIQSYYLVCDFKDRGRFINPKNGVYGMCEYYNITHFASRKNYFKFWKEGKHCLFRWFDRSKKNILIFSYITIFDYPFYVYGKRLGYKIVCDQVETSLGENGNIRFLNRVNIKISDLLLDKLYKHSSAFVISKNLYNEVRSKYPYRKICLLQNSTPQLSKEYRQVLNNPLRILYSGTYSHKDGVRYLLEGVIEAYESGCNLELFLLGKGNDRDMEILDTVKDKNYIHYVGYVSDEELNEYLLKSDILCMTRCNSRFANYGFPFKLSEYLSTGNIVIATNIGDVCDYVEDKKSAYIVPPEDSHSIAVAIQYVSKNPQDSFVVARGGLEAMKKYFSIENVGKKFVEFLKEV